MAPEYPYYAVIFTSQRTDGDKGYGRMARKMEELASQQEGFLGIESARDSELGITVSYWDSLEAIQKWKDHAAHQVAQEKGRTEWYKNYKVRICKVERDYSFEL
ncbi:antibiotic biosynthesis monooxygenase [Pullulanibacillus sp. KACC 23026]|uniref:antibiotic biosynthesis monooxygenase family protein n=1 Tax=Pullulanibacillus sp. KACC 23026 TaxID=3028315 RepID=UPI0023AF846C|nr:antibiotic biosynthesis monooxygenase [Pullulanibacillus sp. KACC 23026]WEG14892.1 antibiotic biosynthesis monooxygenase [Pullulanibacillus sp. KACC 23026]